jgi:pimeloyl-ACP methyl ester carboxylesterase
MLNLQNIQPTFTFSTIVIVEPMLSANGSQHLDSLRKRLIARAKNRRELWPSRENLKKAFINSQSNAANWDPRVLESFANHALHWNPEAKGFSLSCSPRQEIAMYLDEEGATKPVEDLNTICHRIPVHLILGEVPDFIPADVHQALINPASGRRFASLTTLKNVGHLVPQQAPTVLASHIFDILSANSQVPVVKL